MSELMDAEVFAIMCDNYEKRITALEQDNGRLREGLHRCEIETLCVIRGGHEFESVGGIGHKRCKYCLKYKDEQ